MLHRASELAQARPRIPPPIVGRADAARGEGPLLEEAGLDRRRSLGRIAFGAAILWASFGPLGGSARHESVAVALASPAGQTGGAGLTTGSAAEVSGTEG